MLCFYSSSLFCVCVLLFFFFFFQAEDGIRDADVTGVQTCALPICRRRAARFAPTTARPPYAPSGRGADRESTRLNSSHVRISYAVFCLKKKSDLHGTVAQRVRLRALIAVSSATLRALH